MNSWMFSRLLLLVLVIVQVVGARSAQAVIVAPSNGGNSLQHAIGWQTFTPHPNRPFGISDKTPDSNSTFDTTPVGSHAVVPGGGVYLTGIIGPDASIQGHDGAGESTNNGFLQGPTFGSRKIGSAPFGMNIVDVPDADGTFPGTRQNLQEVSGSSWRFKQDGGLLGDFSIKNESDYIFRLERIHFDARVGDANSAFDLDLVYLAGNPKGVVDANLTRADNNNELLNLKVITALTFDPNLAPDVINKTASVAAALSPTTAARLAPGDLASFRFRWTNQWTPFAESQIDNLAISGTFGFLDPSNTFVEIDPAAVTLPCDFDGNGNLDVQDIDLMAHAIQTGANPPQYDLNADSQVNFDDFQLLIESPNCLNTWIGDSDLNGQFDEQDIVIAFIAGQYLTSQEANWAAGDWDGNLTFNEQDFVGAFIAGGYLQGPRAAGAAVPEPNSGLLIALGLCVMTQFRRR